MATHPLRRLLHKIGIDVRRHRKEPEPFSYFSTLGIRTVIDVGANTGQFSKEARDTLPSAQIHSFEPLPDCYEQLCESFKGDALFTAYNCALGENTGLVSMNRSSYTPSSSLLTMSEIHKKLFPHTAHETKTRIRIERMDDALSQVALTPPMLLKIDTQGYEDRVLAGGPETLAKTDAVLIEASFVSLYADQPLFANIYTLLTAKGFIYRGALQQKRGPTGEILFEDALFIRAK